MAAPRGRRTKYPWAEWTDGAQWLIYEGEDYAISGHNMQISLHGRAKKEDMKVSSASFTDRTPDESGMMQVRRGLMFQYYRDDE